VIGTGGDPAALTAFIRENNTPAEPYQATNPHLREGNTEPTGAGAARTGTLTGLEGEVGDGIVRWAPVRWAEPLMHRTALHMACRKGHVNMVRLREGGERELGGGLGQRAGPRQGQSNLVVDNLMVSLAL
jgi:hypothetical protein